MTDDTPSQLSHGSAGGAPAFVGRELLDRLRETEQDLESLISKESAGGDELLDDEWSAAAVVAHLADAELVYGFRLRKILAEDAPRLTSYDERTWNARFGALEPSWRESFGRWRALRASNIRILESATRQDWDRAGLHADRGEVTLADIVGKLVTHDRGHLDQIRRGLAPAIPHSA